MLMRHLGSVRQTYSHVCERDIGISFWTAIKINLALTTRNGFAGNLDYVDNINKLCWLNKCSWC